MPKPDITLYTGDETNQYSVEASDSRGRKVDVVVHADTPSQAADQATYSATDYNLSRVGAVRQIKE